jgi:hypothetical protein
MAKGHLLYSDLSIANQGPSSVACAAGPGTGYYQLFAGAKIIVGDLLTGAQTAVASDDPNVDVTGAISVDDAGRAYWFEKQSDQPVANFTIRSFDPTAKVTTSFDWNADFALPVNGSILTMTAGEANKLYFLTKAGTVLVVDVATKQTVDLQKTGITLITHQMGQPIFAARASSNPDDVASNVGAVSTLAADGTEKALLDLQPLFGQGHGFGTFVTAIRVKDGQLYLGTGAGVYRTMAPVL